jgi:hypothetical protein
MRSRDLSCKGEIKIERRRLKRGSYTIIQGLIEKDRNMFPEADAIVITDKDFRNFIVSMSIS